MKNKYRSLAIMSCLIVLTFNQAGLSKTDSLTAIPTSIVINGNVDFLNQASIYGWSGTGSVSNPFIIKGYVFIMSGLTSVNISNTDYYFILENISISGSFTPSSTGIYLYNATNGIIRNVSVSSSYFGLYLDFSANNTVIDSNFTSNSIGIVVSYSDNVLIKNNTANLSSNGIGIRIISSSDLNIINNTFSNNNQWGLYASSTNNSSFLENVINGNLMDGLYFISSNNNLISNNVISNNQNGISLSISSFFNVSGNDIKNSINNGIYSQSCQNNSFNSNNLTSNDYGFHISSSSNNSLSNNLLNRNNMYGFYFNQNSLNNSIANNTVIASTFGIYLVLSSTNNAFYYNSISENNVGIEIQTSSDRNEMLGNNISSNSVDGIRLLSNSNQVEGNYVFNNSVSGIKIQGTDNIIRDNIIKNNTGYGLDVTSTSSKTQITHNDFTCNGGTTSQASDSGSGNIVLHNYWNTHQKIDENSDSFIDFPYLLDGSSLNYDAAPLLDSILTKKPVLQFPGTISSLQAQFDNNTVQLSWNTPYNGGSSINYYFVHRGTTSGVYSQVFISKNTFFNDSVDPGMVYFYSVTAINEIGESAFSNEVNLSIPNKMKLVVPSKPVLLKVPNTGEGFVYLTWNTPLKSGGSLITKYFVYRGTTSGEYTTIFISKNLFFNDTSIKNGLTYYYAVTAINSIGESAFSNEINQTTAVVNNHPSTPLTPSISVEKGFIQLIWNAPENDGGSPVIRYNIYRGISSGEYGLIFLSTGLSYADFLVSNGMTYYYVITAENVYGESLYSVEVQIKFTQEVNTSSTSSSGSGSTSTSATQPNASPGFEFLVILSMLGLLAVFRKYKYN